VARLTLILAGNPREGGQYARRLGMRPSAYRVVHDSGQIGGIQHADVHILPSFVKSIQRHAIFAALKYGYRIEYFYVDPDDMPTYDEMLGDLQAKELGELTDDILEAAYAEHAEFDHEAWRAARQRELVLQLSPEEFDRILAELDKPAEVVPELVEAVKKAAEKPRAPRPTKAASPSLETF
jgi:uncharacterized protein (DUF1778 family)